MCDSCISHLPLSEKEWRTVSGHAGGATSSTGSALTPPAPVPSTSLPARAWPARMRRPAREGMSVLNVVKKQHVHVHVQASHYKEVNK